MRAGTETGEAPHMPPKNRTGKAKREAPTEIPPYLRNMHPGWKSNDGDPDDDVSRYFNYLAALELFEERSGIDPRGGGLKVDSSIPTPPVAVRGAAMVAQDGRAD